MKSLLQDWRFSLRMFGNRPGFALMVVAILAIGIGANTAIFSVLKSVLLDALPFARPGQLVSVAQRNGIDDERPVTVGYATYLDWKSQLPAFDAIAVSSSWQPNLAGDAGAELLDGQSVTREFFSVLGVTPQIGRSFTAEEDQPDRNDVVLLSAGLWQRQFNADPGILGRRIPLGSRSYTVVGVLPASFEPLLPATLGRPPDVWRPLGYDLTKGYACRSCLHLQAIGRLTEGVGVQAAQAQLDALAAGLISQYANDYPAGMSFELHSLRDALVGPVDRSLWLLFAGVGLVLMVACVDIASLMSVRAISRRHELSVRAALGASQASLARAMAVDSAVLALCGGLLGMGLAYVATDVIAQMGPASIPRLRSVHVDRGALVFASLLTLFVALATGLLPAWRASRAQLSDAMKDAGRVSVGPATSRLQSGLVVVQVAIASVLMLGAMLMLRSFQRLQDVDPGFVSAGVATFNLAIVGPRYVEAAPTVALLRQLEDRVAALPGVERVGAVTPLPLAGNLDTAGFHIKDRPIGESEAPQFDRVFATPGYFRTLHIPLHSGRVLADSDVAGQPLVAVVNESLARREWPGESPLGKQIQLGARDEKAPWFTVVGVVGDVRQHALDLDSAPQVYLAHAQSDSPPSYLALTVGTSLPMATIANQVRELARGIDPGVPIYDAKSMQARLAESTARRRFMLLLFGLFAATALMLSMVGIFGVVAYSVQRQTAELGLRRALGASNRSVLHLVARQGLRFLCAGLAIGMPLSLAWTQFLTGELYGVSRFDPWSLGAVVLGLSAAVGLALMAPTIRALRIDPMVALRHE
jgi:putative ABC transport system permease protein